MPRRGKGLAFPGRKEKAFQRQANGRKKMVTPIVKERKVARESTIGKKSFLTEKG